MDLRTIAIVVEEMLDQTKCVSGKAREAEEEEVVQPVPDCH